MELSGLTEKQNQKLDELILRKTSLTGFPWAKEAGLIVIRQFRKELFEILSEENDG